MKKLALIIIGLLMGLMSYSQYPTHNLPVKIITAEGSSGVYPGMSVGVDTLLEHSHIILNYGNPGDSLYQNLWIINITNNPIDVFCVKMWLVDNMIFQSYNTMYWDGFYDQNYPTIPYNEDYQMMITGSINILPHDTCKSFSSHFYSNGISYVNLKFLFCVDTINNYNFVGVRYNTYYNGINDIDKNNIKIYPNPTTDYVYFDKEFKNVRVFDLYGNIVNFYNKTKIIDLSSQPSGIYIININELNYKIIKI
jgi:hypothetical protein